jgi:hypothetical protein
MRNGDFSSYFKRRDQYRPELVTPPVCEGDIIMGGGRWKKTWRMTELEFQDLLDGLKNGG